MGIDGSEAMLELARESGLYRDLKQSMLGEEPLPVQWGNLMVHYFRWVIDHCESVANHQARWFYPVLVCLCYDNFLFSLLLFLIYYLFIL